MHYRCVYVYGCDCFSGFVDIWSCGRVGLWVWYRILRMSCEWWVCVAGWGFFFFKQKTAYEMRISDWSSDVCSSDLAVSCSGGPALAIARCLRLRLGVPGGGDGGPLRHAAAVADDRRAPAVPGVHAVSAALYRRGDRQRRCLRVPGPRDTEGRDPLLAGANPSLSADPRTGRFRRVTVRAPNA